ncbi:hypothetical protein BDW22DRAFT_32680 [Trametopsis cervina]|nr:hypothetical protein BDW22DRAFT_32680 [Trametopsis cervina]
MHFSRMRAPINNRDTHRPAFPHSRPLPAPDARCHYTTTLYTLFMSLLCATLLSTRRGEEIRAGGTRVGPTHILAARHRPFLRSRLPSASDSCLERVPSVLSPTTLTSFPRTMHPPPIPLFPCTLHSQTSTEHLTYARIAINASQADGLSSAISHPGCRSVPLTACGQSPIQTYHTNKLTVPPCLKAPNIPPLPPPLSLSPPSPFFPPPHLRVRTQMS